MQERVLERRQEKSIGRQPTSSDIESICRRAHNVSAAGRHAHRRKAQAYNAMMHRLPNGRGEVPRPSEDSDRDSCVGRQPTDKSKQHDNEQGDMGAETYLVHLLTHMVPIHCGGDNFQIIRTLISNKPELVRHLVSIFINDFLQGCSGLNSVGTRTT